jgi:hypothetical protein
MSKWKSINKYKIFFNSQLVKALYFPLVFALYLALFQNVKRLGYLFLNIFAVKCHLISFF